MNLPTITLAHNTGQHTTRKAPGEEFKGVKAAATTAGSLLLPLSFHLPLTQCFHPLWLGLVFPPKDTLGVSSSEGPTF